MMDADAAWSDAHAAGYDEAKDDVVKMLEAIGGDALALVDRVKALERWSS